MLQKLAFFLCLLGLVQSIDWSWFKKSETPANDRTTGPLKGFGTYPLWKFHKYDGFSLKPVPLNLEIGPGLPPPGPPPPPPPPPYQSPPPSYSQPSSDPYLAVLSPPTPYSSAPPPPPSYSQGPQQSPYSPGPPPTPYSSAPPPPPPPPSYSPPSDYSQGPPQPPYSPGPPPAPSYGQSQPEAPPPYNSQPPSDPYLATPYTPPAPPSYSPPPSPSYSPPPPPSYFPPPSGYSQSPQQPPYSSPEPPPTPSYAQSQPPPPPPPYNSQPAPNQQSYSNPQSASYSPPPPPSYAQPSAPPTYGQAPPPPQQSYGNPSPYQEESPVYPQQPPIPTYSQLLSEYFLKRSQSSQGQIQSPPSSPYQSPPPPPPYSQSRSSDWADLKSEQIVGGESTLKELEDTLNNLQSYYDQQQHEPIYNPQVESESHQMVQETPIIPDYSNLNSGSYQYTNLQVTTPPPSPVFIPSQKIPIQDEDQLHNLESVQNTDNTNGEEINAWVDKDIGRNDARRAPVYRHHSKS